MKIEKNGGSELCGSVLDNFSSSREIVTHCCLLLTNIGNANATMATKMGECGIVDVILSIIGQQQEDASMVLEPIHTLSILKQIVWMFNRVRSRHENSLSMEKYAWSIVQRHDQGQK